MGKAIINQEGINSQELRDTSNPKDTITINRGGASSRDIELLRCKLKVEETVFLRCTDDGNRDRARISREVSESAGPICKGLLKLHRKIREGRAKASAALQFLMREINWA